MCFYQEAQAYADDNSLLYMETSAKTAMNVNEIFMAIGEQPSVTFGERERRQLQLLLMFNFMTAAGFTSSYIQIKWRHDRTEGLIMHFIILKWF